MQTLQTIVLIIAAVVLFIHGLQNFSKEIQHFGEAGLKKWIGKITNTRIGAFLLGGIVTAIIQSSSAVSALTVTLVDSGIIGFRESLAILLGTNVGTTTTAWIVTLKSDLIGPFFIVLGTLISVVPTKISTAGKSIFYFGFIFFSLHLVSESIEPIKNNPFIIQQLMKASNPYIGVLYGILFTALIQSSSVISGMAVILISQNILTLEAAIPIIIGANIGTTSTALIASLKLSPTAKLAAFSNFLFNLIGVLIVFPFIELLENFSMWLSHNPPIQVAYAHLIFNLFIAVLFLIFLNPIYKLLSKIHWFKPKSDKLSS